MIANLTNPPMTPLLLLNVFTARRRETRECSILDISPVMVSLLSSKEF
jgi:hypothetical protein